MLTNRRKIRIEWGDCDPAQIVYFPRYFEYFDACTSALFERAGLPKQQLIQQYRIIGIPLVDIKCRFLVPSRFGDDVVVESSISEWKRSSFSVYHKLLKEDVLAVECFEVRVWTAASAGDARRIQGQPVPQEVIERFA